jgi:GNAT superfamily N-acetyltransferase
VTFSRHPWEDPVETPYGLVRWQEVGDPIGSRFCYLMLADPDEGFSVLVGYMTVEDPQLIDEDTRRPSDPIDRRVDTVWVHPIARHQGIGKSLGLVAKRYALFESHSSTRTGEGTGWAKSLNEAPPEAETKPTAEDFDKGAHRYYGILLQANPDLIGVGDD